MPKIIVDPESTSLAERFALVKTARRRGRFPAGCVTEVPDAATALAGADAARLDAALAPIKAEPGRQWRRIPPGLEDVFIHLMKNGELPSAAQERPR